jgi:hypothetical protein
MSSEPEMVVLLVRPDPEPVVFTVSFAGERTIAPANFDRVNGAFLLKA